MTAPGQNASGSPPDCRFVWLLPVWELWPTTGYIYLPTDPDVAARPYLHWNIAQNLADSPSDVGRGTAIQKLWNAVTSKIATFQDFHRISQLRPIFTLSRKTSLLQVLESAGVIRRRLLREVRALRNLIEHQDRGAPDTSRCQNLCESVWYLLRSTDAHVLKRPLQIDLGNSALGGLEHQPSYSVNIDFGDPEWLPAVRGVIPPEALLESLRDGVLKLLLERRSRGVTGGSLRFSGRVSELAPSMRPVVKRYFFGDLAPHF